MFTMILKILLFAIWFTLFMYGLFVYEESKLLYVLFSIVFLILLLSAFYKTTTYSYLFLSLFLFLGIWMKLTLHLIFKYAYVEPIGYFYTSHTQMDTVLLVAIAGALALLSVNSIYRKLNLQSTTETVVFSKTVPSIYIWYKKYEVSIMLFVLFITVVFAFFNLKYAIQLSGVVPKTILVYPFNALIYWVLGVGFTLLIAILISWDIRFDKKILIKNILIYILVAAVSSIAILSRGQYIFTVGALLVFLILHYQNYKNFNLKKIIMIILFAAFLYLCVIVSVTHLREFFYTGDVLSSISVKHSLSHALTLMMRLAADRWVGLEGIMAVAAYPEKSFDLFLNALTQKAVIGHIDIYQYISNAHYKDMDNMKYAFATIPGVIAFLYYSGSLVIVFLGMFFLTTLMLLIEYLVYRWMKCSLIASIVGIYLANAVAQFGLTPINLLKSFFLIFSFFAFIKLLKSDFLENIFNSFKVSKS